MISFPFTPSLTDRKLQAEMMDHRKHKHWTDNATLGQCFLCLVWAPASPQRTEHYLKGELIYGSMHKRARCVPLMMFLLSTLIQNSVRTRRDETSQRCHHPCTQRYCGTAGLVIFQIPLQDDVNEPRELCLATHT